MIFQVTVIYKDPIETYEQNYFIFQKTHNTGIFYREGWYLGSENILKKWIVVCLNFMLLNILATLSVTAILNGLQKSMIALANSQERLNPASKMEAIGLLAGGVAHDLNNILSGVITYPELLAMELDACKGNGEKILIIDDLETYRQILEFKPEQKAIIVSGFSKTIQVTKALDLGAGQYINKPYTIEKLGVAVKNELLKTR